MSALEARLDAHGLLPRGVTRLEAGEVPGFAAGERLMLVGNAGSSYWVAFSRSAEFADGDADPLDRWSRRVAESLAREFGLTALYPFDGPPYLPFQRWARRAEGLDASPLGILIHPRYGLWHSYRFALLGIDTGESMTDPRSPCLDCIGEPCLDACPAAAVSRAGYDADRCAGFLEPRPAAECLESGCLARYACPVGAGWRYRPAQGRFHLAAFLAARRGAPL